MNYILPTYPYRGKTFTSGQGVYLYDDRGKKYLDLMTNYGVNIFGHSHPKIIKVLKSQLDQLTNLHGSFANDIRNQASQKLVHVCGGKLTQVYWANSGAEAVEAAIKFTIVASEKTHFIATQGSYHGKTLGALALTHSPKYRLPFKKVLSQTSFVPYGNILKLKAAITKNTAAVILEPIQGETGIILPYPSYLRKVAAFCRQNQVILILDEIQTGVGRIGTFLASQQDEIQPDIVCLGKGLAGGIPVGATLVSQPIADKLTHGIHTSTFGGNPLACAGVLVTLKLLTPKQLQRNSRLGGYFLRQLQTLKSPRIKATRGKGLMLAIELTQKSTPTLKALQDQGILAIPAGDQVVRFLPPYIITKKQLDTAINVLKQICVDF